MGEMADFVNDDMYLTDEWYPPASISCRYCGYSPLWLAPTWPDGKGPWRLINEKGEVHTCSEYYEKR